MPVMTNLLSLATDRLTTVSAGSDATKALAMKLRRATIDDAAEACAILRRSISELCHQDHEGDETVLGKWLSNKTVENVSRWIAQSHFLVAEEAGCMLGVAAMTEAGEITLNYVAPEARFRGVSKALLRQLEEDAKALGIAQCTLESTKTALRFYRNLGYIEIGEGAVFPLTGSVASALAKRTCR